MRYRPSPEIPGAFDAATFKLPEPLPSGTYLGLWTFDRYIHLNPVRAVALGGERRTDDGRSNRLDPKMIKDRVDAVSDR
jgi:hypothetical protein